ncbi:MAG: protein tyrosine phosphatase, partial [Pseudomonadota bacterium]
MRAARGELKTPWQRFLGRLEFYFGDHAIFRMLYLNKHTVAPGVFRSAQPSPGHIRQFAKDGIKTVVNLRGERDCAGDTFEREACAAA